MTAPFSAYNSAAMGKQNFCSLFPRHGKSIFKRTDFHRKMHTVSDAFGDNINFRNNTQGKGLNFQIEKMETGNFVTAQIYGIVSYMVKDFFQLR